MQEKKHLLVILATSLLVSAFFGYSSTTLSGHEAIIYPMLEGIFLIIYGVALISFATIKENKKDTRMLLLTTVIAMLGGYFVYMLCSLN